MTYTAEKSTVRQSTKERQLITIEFAPNVDPNEIEYSYEQPQFVFGEQVLRQANSSISSEPLSVCGMELVESKTPSGQLLNQPYWKYLVNDGQQKTWLSESALVPYPTSCSQCSYFQSHHDSEGRGWCNLFGTAARQHHPRTNDCDLHADKDPIDAPHSRFAIESIVKIIDPDEHHTEWATFVVIARKYNTQRYRSTDSYLSEPLWYYQLANMEVEETIEPIWVAENEICQEDQSHNICTDDIF